MSPRRERRREPFSEAERLTAAAMTGDPLALEEAIRRVASGELAVEEIGARAAVLLAHRAARAEPSLEPPLPLRSLRARAAALWLLIERSLRSLGGALAAADVSWAPIKGADLATCVYAAPDLRPMADVDLLVREAEYPAARRALERAGWTSGVPGDRFDRFVAEEGSAWTAVHEALPLPVELHLRLWGFAPAGLGDALLARAAPDPELGPAGRRLRLADAFVLAALHPWLHLPPRRLGGWWEVRAILEAGGEALVPEILAVAGETGLELPVLLSAAQVETLWDDPRATALRGLLTPRLRAAERAAAHRALRRSPNETSIERLALARLLAGRSSRSGLRPIYRRLWAHPGIVERLTPAAWSWPRRRAVHVLQCLHLLPAPRADWWRAPTHGHRAPPDRS